MFLDGGKKIDETFGRTLVLLICVPIYQYHMSEDTMMTSPNLTAGFPSRRPETGSLDVFFDLRVNKRLSKQLKRQLFETS